MKKYNWFLTVLVLLAFMFVMNTDAQAAGLSANDVKFHENWTDNYKPIKGAFAAKWYYGKAQVMCYNQSSRSSLPAAMLQEILDYLSANRPQTTADMADQNFAYKQFETAEARTASKATQVAQPKIMAAAAPAPPVQVKDDSAAKNLAELNALKNELADAKAAEIKRLKDAAKPAVKAKRVTAPTVSALDTCRARVDTLESARVATDKSLVDCKTALGKANADLKTSEINLKNSNDGWRACEQWYKNALQKAKDALTNARRAQEDKYALSTVNIWCLISFIIGLIIGAIFLRSRRSSKNSNP